jgi:hypothetical protein
MLTIRGILASAALLALVGVPVEFTIGLVEHPIVAPPHVASLLLIGSCLLLIGSGLGLRRIEIERGLTEHRSPGA